MASNFFARRFAAVVTAVVVIGGIAPVLGGQRDARVVDMRRFFPDDPLWVDDDRRDIPPVARQELSDTYDFLENTAGKAPVTRGPALNMNTLGEVPDSSWFTNRLGVRDLSIDEILRGPNTTDGPAPGTWEVLGRPGTGITPKFTIRDARGHTYLIKLDPPAHPELASSVELISTKIFHAIGYHVPEDHLASLDPGQLRMAKGASVKRPGGGRRPLELEEVLRWLRDQPRQADGTIRVLASRWLPGKVVGSFRFYGTRSDDPNDIYPHERRRELRGLRLFAAWLNHDDARALNSLDSYVEEDGRRYLRHYLQDFGSTLGSGSTAAQQPRAGHEYIVEGDKIGKGLLTFGLWQRDWMKARYAPVPSIGNVAAESFDPAAWKPEYPHPAMDQMDANDAFWAARIAARFSDEAIKAIVDAARLSDDRAAAHLASVIIRRRDKAVEHGITGTNPLDSFVAVRDRAGVTLTFDHAAARLGLVADRAHYEIGWASLDNMRGIELDAAGDTAGDSRELRVPAAAWGPEDVAGFRYAIASIRTLQPGHPHWALPVRVTLRARGDDVTVVAIDRPTTADASSGTSRH
jgi:hypothetical protein